MITTTAQKNGLFVGSKGQVSASGVELIKEFEGCYLDVYPDPLTRGKPYTVGWGCTRKRDGSEWRLGESITQEEADDLLIEQLEDDYLPQLQKIPVWDELNANQQGAILSFGYNLGPYFYGGENFQTITRVLKNKQWDRIKDALLLYRNPGSRVEAGLKRRRLAEAKLFLTPVEEVIDQAEFVDENDDNGHSVEPEPPSVYWLKVTANTVAKQAPVQSGELSDEEKVTVAAGHQFQIMSYEPSENGHIGVTLFSQVKVKERSTWAFFKDHIEIWEVNGDKKIGKYKVGDTLPPSVNIPVPWYSQRDNRFRPSGSCNVTSVAMCLAYYGIRPKYKSQQLEDELFRMCEQKGWDRHVHVHLKKIFEAYGINDTFKVDATWDEVRTHLANKNPVIYSGTLTHSGHIIVLRGYDQKGFWVNDPWGEFFYSGYQNISGENLHYSNNLLQRKAITGSSRVTWAHFPEKPQS